MEITYLGDFSFGLKQKKISVVLNPARVEFVSGSGKVLEGPGEYEVEGVSVFGVSLGEHVFYSIEIGGVRVGYVDSSGEKVTDSKSNLIGELDALILPFGDNDASLISEFEPRYIVPVGDDEEKRNEFVKKTGFRVENSDKLVVDQGKDFLPSNDQVIFFLKKRS